MKSLLLATVVAITSLAAAPAFSLEGVRLAPGGHDRPHRGTAAPSTYTCSDELGLLRRVYSEEIDAIYDQIDVTVTPVCSDSDYGVMRNDGNAGALRQAIALNDATAGALAAANFRPEDVIGVRMTGDEKAILYVHTFLYR